MKHLRYFAVALLAAVIGLTVFGQEVVKDKLEKVKDKVEHKVAKAFCSNQNWSGDKKVSVNDLRETTVAAGSLIDVDAGKNGGISIKGGDRSDVLVRACVQAWGTSEEEAKTLAGGVRVSTSGTIKADGPNNNTNHWSVSFEIHVPRSTNLKLLAHNGGISITNVDGNAEFETMNGGVKLAGVAGDFRGRTMNGGVHVSLTGSSWKGAGLDVTTTNGGVMISMPSNYAARIQTGTVNGGFSSNIAGLSAPKTDESGHRQPVRINTDINGGGATIKVSTTNGGVVITATDGN